MNTTTTSVMPPSITNTLNLSVLPAMLGGKRTERWKASSLIDESGLVKPLYWSRPRHVLPQFDPFHESVPDEWIDKIFAVMALAPQHTFQVLTKRPKRMREYLNDLRRPHKVARALLDLFADWKLPKQAITNDAWPVESEGDIDAPSDVFIGRWPLPNVMLGVTAEDQTRADERIPDLLATPAAKRFVSCEPLLSAIDLSKWLHDGRRKSIPRSDCLGSFQGGTERDHLALGAVDGRRPSFGSGLYSETSGRDKFASERELSPHHVQGRGSAPSGRLASYRLDGHEQASDTAEDGSQSHRRRPDEQFSEQFGDRHASTECAAFAYLPNAEEEGSTRRNEFVGECDGNTGSGNSGDLEKSVAISARDSGEVQRHAIDHFSDRSSEKLDAPSLNWVIAGGESGSRARPSHPDWLRSLRDQCAAAGVPFFFKQWGEWAPHKPKAGGDLGGDMRRGIVRHLQFDREPDGHFRKGDCYVARVGKRRAGALLDGKEHKEFPR